MAMTRAEAYRHAKLQREAAMAHPVDDRHRIEAAVKELRRLTPGWVEERSMGYDNHIFRRAPGTTYGVHSWSRDIPGSIKRICARNGNWPVPTPEKKGWRFRTQRPLVDVARILREAEQAGLDAIKVEGLRDKPVLYVRGEALKALVAVRHPRHESAHTEAWKYVIAGVDTAVGTIIHARLADVADTVTVKVEPV